MGTEFKVEVIHKEIIAPSTPTPHQLKSVSLSVFDQIVPEVYVPLLLFYPNHTVHEVDIDPHSLVAEKSSLLKASLSETLSHFYPFAGKFQYNDSICCDDHGAAFIEARVNCPISKILEKPDLGILKHLFPAAAESSQSTQAVTGHLVLVQVNFFECGGLAIGVSISHKVADAYTFSTFIKSWAAVALGSSPVLPAEFGAAASLFPPQDFFNSSKPVVEFVQEKCTTRRFVFDASRIAALKSKAASAAVPNPTRVEVVSALIWKCAMEASRSNLGSIRPSLWCQVVNMRKRSGQDALTENLLGNFSSHFAAMTVESEVDLQCLVAKFRKCMEEFKANHANGVTAEYVCQSFKQSGNIFAKEGIDNYSCSSWCWLPFYEANFGWGKPSWVSIRSIEFKNIIVLMDVKDGNGIEASLTFLDQDMALVETNQELLAYASLNPSVI
ncbi:hypothetical protein M0R45_014339 [Rubus argutus]|uniref:BAHD acyltransferase n=1 Tax=Rubus argutus TaxID=59490 RepID=A0AAW1XNU7_RUBAR